MKILVMVYFCDNQSLMSETSLDFYGPCKSSFYGWQPTSMVSCNIQLLWLAAYFYGTL